MGVRSVGVEGGVTAGDRCSQCPPPHPLLSTEQAVILVSSCHHFKLGRKQAAAVRP